jgi:hypothetical protein
VHADMIATSTKLKTAETSAAKLAYSISSVAADLSCCRLPSFKFRGECYTLAFVAISYKF